MYSDEKDGDITQTKAETEGTGGDYPSKIETFVVTALDALKGEFEAKITSLGAITKIAIFALAIAIIGFLVAIIAIVVDIKRDVSRYDSLNKDIQSQNQQITDLNQELIQHREDDLEDKIYLQCLKLKQGKYWEYPDCFK